MNVFLFSLSLVSTAAGSGPGGQADAQYQQGVVRQLDVATIPALTPEVWQHLQQRRVDTEATRQAVIRNAAQRAAERQARIATLKAYGYSKSRPVVRHTPFTSYLAPQWVDQCYRRCRW